MQNVHFMHNTELKKYIKYKVWLIVKLLQYSNVKGNNLTVWEIRLLVFLMGLNILK